MAETVATLGPGPASRPYPGLRQRDTLRARHTETVRRLAALPVPPPPSVYDPPSEIGFLLIDHIAYLRAAIDALESLFERCADDAADHGGARAESYDLIRAAAEDFIAPISAAAEELTGQA